MESTCMSLGSIFTTIKKERVMNNSSLDWWLRYNKKAERERIANLRPAQTTQGNLSQTRMTTKYLKILTSWSHSAGGIR